MMVSSQHGPHDRSGRGGDAVTDSTPPGHAERPGHFLDELRATFAARAGRPAISYQDRSLTYGELDAQARRCAARLRRLGVEPGDRVAIVTAGEAAVPGGPPGDALRRRRSPCR